MLAEVTQKNLYNLIPYKAAKIASAIQCDRKMGLKQSRLTFYHSKAYRLLEREETKLWHASPAQIYTEYLVETPNVKRHYQNGPRHSKLTPFTDQIQAWHQQGKTLREMAVELKQYGCLTTVQNLSLFWRKIDKKNKGKSAINNS